MLRSFHRVSNISPYGPHTVLICVTIVSVVSLGGWGIPFDGQPLGRATQFCQDHSEPGGPDWLPHSSLATSQLWAGC